MVDYPPACTIIPESKSIVHYWDGYGNLCNTADGRRNTAKSSSVVFEVTCDRCLSNLEKIGKLPTGDPAS